MAPLKPHEQDKLRYLLNAFRSAPVAVQAHALRTLNTERPAHLRAVK